jgi:hypothetical protein
MRRWQVDVFRDDGTWSKPAGAEYVGFVVLVGAPDTVLVFTLIDQNAA